MRINPNVRVHTFKKAMAFASTTSKAEQVMKVVVACPQNMPTIYNVFPSFNVMGFVLLQHKKGENFPRGARQINPQKDMKAKLLHFNKIGCMAHMYFPANLLNYHHSISFLSISTMIESINGYFYYGYTQTYVQYPQVPICLFCPSEVTQCSGST